MKKLTAIVFMMFSCSTDKTDPTPVTPPVDDAPKQYGVPFSNVPATQNVVMYEVNPRAFSTVGNLQGIIDRLDNIKALGVNTIWLMPIHPVGKEKSAGGLGSLYAVQNYREVNPEFGTLEKLRELVQKAHDKNMAVILDWVANHTAWDNVWIKNKSWYTQDASGNIIIPPGTNWQDVAELNFNNADMRKAMIAAMKYWVLEANVDGFRCDAVDFVPADFWKQALDELKAIPGRNLILLAEGGKADNFTSGFQMNYAWDFYNNLKQVYAENKPAGSIFSTHLAEYSSIPGGARKLRYTTNHDQSAYDGTPVALFGGVKGALSASVVTVLTSAVPLLYGSQEVGQAENLPFFTRQPIDWTKNTDMQAAYEKLFAIYNSTTAFTTGSLQYFNSDNIAAFKRVSGADEYLVLVNVRADEQEIILDASLQNSTWTSAIDGSAVSLSTNVVLGGYEYRILKKN
ncbi:alpha-amylase family glycosyl hydrolase [Chryseolinea lacunae]|uniref:Glycosyl hydrolase family 13 catalytic domain-containing protein n=1 Tax=Chryseolinea lacunae TaxID=2801331 RepID=A0ABS1KKQ8_9BACT|nr:alpha-amylase family glycosyl hydrolase [Chryseolinea lacunae]MBL0740054.1 hypothetical protein [Chryseolinea lacunae]